MGLIKNMSGLVVDECQAFDDGAVTFLPVPGESLKRWSHPELSLPQLPYPYSGSQGQHTTFDAHIEGLYGLCSERLAAECLGAMYLNSASFTKPVFGDLTVGKLTQSGHRGRSVIEISIPDLSALSLEGVLRLRHEIPDMSSQFSRAILNVLRPDGVYGQNTEPAIEDLRASAASWTRQIESVLPRNAFGHGDRLVQTTFVLGSGGSGGNTMSTVDFVLKGGTLQDLVKVITEGEEVRLEIRDDSMLAAA